MTISREQTPQEPMRNAKGDEIVPITLESGETVFMTKAEFNAYEGKTRIPHGNVHHDEPPSPDAVPLDYRPNHLRKWITRGTLATVAAAALGGAGFTIAKKSFDDTTEQMGLDNPSVSGPANPGASEAPAAKQESAYAPTDEYIALYSNGDPSLYEQDRTPITLTAEQQADWDSGDAIAQNAVADNTIRYALGAALSDISMARKAGEVADVSYLTTDPNTLAELEAKVDYFDKVNAKLGDVDANTPEVIFPCQTNADYDQMSSLCAADLNNTGLTPNWVLAGGDTILVLQDFAGDDTDAAAVVDGTNEKLRRTNIFKFDSHVERAGDSLVLVSN